VPKGNRLRDRALPASAAARASARELMHTNPVTRAERAGPPAPPAPPGPGAGRYAA